MALGDDRIYLYFISSGSCITESKVPVYGIPRVFDPSDIYVYRGVGSLLVSRDGGGTWTNILPTGMNSVNAIAQTFDGDHTITYAIAPGIARFQNTPEVTAWTSGSTPPVGLVPECAAADLMGEMGILVGNIHSGIESRIVGAFTGSPYALVDADAGIPQSSGSMGLITCLEVCD